MEKNKPDCCQTSKKKPKGLLSGILYGLVPHAGCIAFIVFTILGATTLTAFFKPLLLSRYFFYLLILFSFVLATVSAMIYLKRAQLLSLDGIKQKWKYLSILYGTTITVNLLLFLIIFPLTANLTSATLTGSAVVGLSEITLKVDIPCPGHAPLITEELNTIQGVKSIKFRFPNYFDVLYDSVQTSQQKILSLSIFDIYPATKTAGDTETTQTAPRGCSSCGGCSGACGGTCGT